MTESASFYIGGETETLTNPFSQTLVMYQCDECGSSDGLMIRYRSLSGIFQLVCPERDCGAIYDETFR